MVNKIKKTKEYRISNVFCLSDEIKDATKSQKMSKKAMQKSSIKDGIFGEGKHLLKFRHC